MKNVVGYQRYISYLWRRLKMEGKIEQLLLELQKELENANVQYNNVSTMARIGNSQACDLL